MTPPRIDNRRARRLFMRRHALAEPPTGRLTGDGLLALIERLGFVQVDSIRTVERAHHMILFARNQTYRPKALKRLIERDRALFENWTHDASIIPTRFFPYWRTAMAEKAPRIAARWESYGRVGFREQAEEVMAEIARRGPCLSREMGAEETRSNGGWWEWNPSKTALEYLWRSGRLCVARREGFQKVYDLTENVIPEAHHAAEPRSRGADRLVLRRGARPARLRDDRRARRVLGPDFPRGSEDLGGWPEQPDRDRGGGRRRDQPPASGAAGTSCGGNARTPARMRVLSPFDPMIRDRKRARRLFGFDYTIEVFVPAEKRKYGYYVFPLLEGDRLIGRIDMKADRVLDALVVTGLWLEPGVRRAAGRLRRLESELERQRRLAGVGAVRFDNGWIRD